MRLTASGITTVGSVGQLVVAGGNLILDLTGTLALTGSGGYFINSATGMSICPDLQAQAEEQVLYDEHTQEQIQLVISQLQNQHNQFLQNLNNPSLNNLTHINKENVITQTLLKTNINELRSMFNRTKELFHNSRFLNNTQN